jgi:hypothetical protein
MHASKEAFSSADWNNSDLRRKRLHIPPYF